MATRKALAAVPALPAADSLERATFTRAAAQRDTLPWQQPGVRADMFCSITTKLPEDLWLKLHWLARNGDANIMEIVAKALGDLIDGELKQRGLAP